MVGSPPRLVAGRHYTLAGPVVRKPAPLRSIHRQPPLSLEAYAAAAVRVTKITPRSKPKAAHPIDFSPWLFCTSKGKGYIKEDSGQATGWDSMWQRFMTRLLKETDVKERFTENDLRGKVGSDEVSVERATDLLRHASKEITKRHYRRKAEVIKPGR